MPSYSVFHRFGQAKFAYDGLILISRQFLPLLQLLKNLTLVTEIVTNDSKMIILLHYSKSMKHAVDYERL
jgi:hypothetical protein